MKYVLSSVLSLALVMFAATDAFAFCSKGNSNHSDKKQCSMDKLDANRDGKVTFEEFKSAHDERMQQRFSRMDVNGDGVITEEDRQQRGARFFDTADTNKDGQLSKEEFTAARKAHKKGKGTKGAKDRETNPALLLSESPSCRGFLFLCIELTVVYKMLFLIILLDKLYLRMI